VCVGIRLTQPSPFPGGEDASANAVYLCISFYESVFEFFYSSIAWCVDITDLFHPCECGEDMECLYQNGVSTCAYVCGADEIGGGEVPCEGCGSGEVPNLLGTLCVTCENGESATPGTCAVDPCLFVTCKANASCFDGLCLCDPGYKLVYEYGGDPFEPFKFACVDACEGVVCDGENTHCSDGECVCDTGYHDPDEDGDCTEICGEDEVDPVAEASLLAIAKEPWERGESYSCKSDAVLVNVKDEKGNDLKTSTESLYLYLDYPTNSQSKPDEGDVCTLTLRGPSDSLAYSHSHPHFEHPRDDGVICLGEELNSRREIGDQNEANVDFSSDDKNAARSVDKPLYLVVPNRNKVKVYRKNDNGKWRVENL